MPETPAKAGSTDPLKNAPANTKFVLGTVPYLNVQPNIWAIKQGLLASGQVTIVPDVPRRLAARLATGEFDCAIVPVFEYFRRPDDYAYIPGPAIAARGPVASVLLFSSVPWQQVKIVYLDTSSLTSVHLFKVLAAEHNMNVNFVNASPDQIPCPLPPDTGWVVIGDPALAQTGRHPHTTDLATEWRALTGLPFVFAAWLARRDLNKPALGNLLRQSLEIGLANLPRVANDSSNPFNVSAEFALKYFRENIHYHLGPQELDGWREFGKLCFKHGLITKEPQLRALSDHATIN